jgi:L-seryl-tRNA(Ser) seleniumtransferase
MPHSFTNLLSRFSRRDLFKSSLLMVPALGLARELPAAAAPQTTPASQALRIGPDIYQSIGVRPVINCRGTFTVFGGSLELPQVRAAQVAAAQHYVQLDELAEGIGKRLAELTGAEWGMVPSGCAAGLAHATAACVAGGNPDLHVHIPNLAGFPKDEVVIPVHSRNEYDAAVRSIGVRIVEVADAEQYQAALGPRVAMVYVLAGPQAESGPLNYDTLYSLARKCNVPVLVDAAAEELTVPNVHLKRGATLVGYSGGKCIRGPQTTGLILGRKDLVQAAWIHSAPHHGYGRSMKVGKEEAMGLLAAVEMWFQRDHQAEWNQWTSWLENISNRVSSIDGVTASIRQPEGLSNHTPSLNIRWSTAKIGMTGEEVSQVLFTSEPRITLAGGGGRGASPGDTGVSITPYMMQPGEEKIVAERLHAVLSSAPKAAPAPEKPPIGDVTGEWDVHIEYVASASNHLLYLHQNGNQVEGTHQGDFIARDLFGDIKGDRVKFTSNTTERHGEALTYTFSGTLSGDNMEGNLDLGEYLHAKWTAARHQFKRGRTEA